MFDRTTKRPSPLRGRSTASLVLAGTAVFISLGGSAVAAGNLIRSDDLAPGAVTSAKIRNGAIQTRDLHPRTLQALRAGGGAVGATGVAGPAGAAGSTGGAGIAGATGAAGAVGGAGTNGTHGTHGAAGTEGVDGTDGIHGIDGTHGVDGTDGTDGTHGIDGTDGTHGVVAPLSATAGATALPTATPPTVVVELNVPARNYLVMAKAQLSHTGAGDSVECTLKAGSVVIDRVAMKTMPALAAVPVALQAVTTTSPTTLSVECDVAVANGSADANSLIAVPIG